MATVATFAYSYTVETMAAELSAVGVSTPAPSAHAGDDAHATAGGAGPAVADSAVTSAVGGILPQLSARDRDLSDFLNSWLNVSQMTGTLDGSGNVLAAHGVAAAAGKALWAYGFYRVSAGLAHPLTVLAVDGTNVQCSGGSAGALYRITMVYQDASGAW